MTRIELPYLWLCSPRGKLRAYYRRHGKVARIRAPNGRPLVPGQAGFLDAYQALLTADDPASQPEAPAGRSVAALIAEYRRSDKWRDLAPATQEDYGRQFRELERLYGTQSAAGMERIHVLAIRAQFAAKTVTVRDDVGDQTAARTATPARANKIIRIISLLLAFAVDQGWRKDNPALRPGRLRTGPGYATWTEANFRQLVDCPDVPECVKRAVVLGFYSGLRISDCIALPRSARRNGTITITPHKTARSTGATVTIPEHPELTRFLDAAPATGTVTMLTLLTRHDGMPWKKSHLGRALARAMATAGLPPGLSFHGLRKGLTAHLAEHGATDAEIDSVIPHADAKMTRHYRAAANQKRVAGAAIARLPDRSK